MTFATTGLLNKDIAEVIATDMAAVDRLIASQLSTDVALIQQVASYLITAGGKRLRPRLVLLWARAAVGSTLPPKPQCETMYRFATIIEFIHSATLLHDDVVDDSSVRRGRKTANYTFGNAASVLVGDFIYSRAFQMMVGLPMQSIAILANATNVIAEGEVLQLLHRGTVNEKEYLTVIERKTAQLFAAGCELGVLAIEGSQEACMAARRYGYAIGMAFQMIDDVLDYSGDVSLMGKAMGDDLREGKVTLPLIYTLQAVEAPIRAQILAIVAKGLEGNCTDAELNQVQQWVVNSDAINASRNRAQQFVDEALVALEILPASQFKQELQALALQALGRQL